METNPAIDATNEIRQAIPSQQVFSELQKQIKNMEEVIKSCEDALKKHA